jgi:phytoene/squalene synthetase
MDKQVNLQVNAFDLRPSHTAYLKNQMDKVSRSFAVVVECLEQPLRSYLATAYLLCRVADNIEDCAEMYEWRLSCFNDFLSLLDEPARADEILKTWSSNQWQGLTPRERAMMTLAQGKELWQIYANIPDPYREIIHRWTGTMVQGMICLNETRCSPSFLEHQDIQVIKTLQDYDEYCFIVAGTVGHMATELAIMFYDISVESSAILVGTSETCGRALQKTNILKDFRGDLERGYCYLPDEWLKQIDYLPLTFDGASKDWKAMVYDNVLDELNTAIDYVLALPQRAIGYRLACLLCLLPALQTNQLAAHESWKLFTADHQYKISRPVMIECLRDARRMVADNDLIQSYGNRLLAETKSSFMRPS